MKKITVILLTVSLLLLTSCAEQKAETVNLNEPYATVNGEIITVEEIEYFKKRDRADIINEFSEKYNISDFSSFWETEYDGKNPTDELEKRALDDAVLSKIKLIEMKKCKIYEDISFNSLKILVNEYNESHKNQSGTVGISSIDLSSFYTYYIETGEMELKNKLAETTLLLTQNEIDEYMKLNNISDADSARIGANEKKYEDYIESLCTEAKVEKQK